MNALTSAAERRAGDPLQVAEAIAHALESARPRATYTVGADARLRTVFALLPAPLRERAILRRLRDAAPA